MRIVATGGAGYIGSHVVAELLAVGHEVLVIDNLANSTEAALQPMGQLFGRMPGFARLDLRDRAPLTELLCAFRPDAVIHLAGLKDVGESGRDPLSYHDVNVGGTIALLSAMAAAACRQIVFSSSATVYGAAAYLPFDEDHPTRPANPYGQTKLMAEQIMRDCIAAGTLGAALALRYFIPVGAHDSGLLGENPRNRPAILVPIIAQVAAG